MVSKQPEEEFPTKDGVNGSAREITIIPLTSQDKPQQKVELRNKVALIVGGASENGRALATAFAERAMDVVLLYFNGAHGLASDIKQQVEEHERRCLLIAGEEIDGEVDELFALEAMKQILETFGRLDVFINFSAHALPFGNLLEPEQKQPEDVRSRIFPHFNMMKAALNQIVN